MNKFIMLPVLALALTFAAQSALAEETGKTTRESVSDSARELGDNVSDGAKKAGRSTKRAFKKGVNRTQETFCAKGDMECAAQKAKHRMEETGDSMKDAGKNAKDAVTE